MKFVIFVLAAIAYLNAASSLKVVPVKDGLTGDATTTRYWDCCKPTCAWTANTNTASPISSCDADGETLVDAATPSACGATTGAYLCTNEAPQIVSDTVAYGFAAASIVGATDNLCCACFNLEFQGDLEGKSMTVQLSNTGVDANATTSNFNLELPGGGVGYYIDSCAQQWNTEGDIWGEQYGGVATEADCAQLPAKLQDGCVFRFEWMKGVSNPKVTYTQVDCPAELVAASGCDPTA